jgi:DNA-binding GntR family transcriptional regulator
VRLSEKAYQLIKHKIITLELRPSTVIDEQSLMDELELGRTPIREALQRLDSENLVNVVPRRGTFVTDVSLTDLQKIFELRIVLEGFCARLAARRITLSQIDQMKSILEDLDKVESGDYRRLISIDDRFHAMLYQAADNEFLSDVLSRLYDLSLRLWYLVLNHLDDVQESIEQHRAVARALQSGDGERAEELIKQHVVEFQKQIKAVL